MTILVIAADLIPNRLGGAEVHAVEVIKRLARHHKIIVFVGKDTSIKSLFPKNVKVIPIKYPRVPNLMGLSYILFGYSQICAKLAAWSVKPDLLWAKQTFPQGVLGARLKQKWGLPLYITAQNPRLHYEELVIKGSVFKPFKQLWAALLDPLIRWSYAKADCVAAVSRYAGTLAKQYQAKKIVIIPNGINPLDFKMHRRGNNKPWQLFTSSSLIPRNGIDILINAVSQIPSTFNWHLTIAGDGLLYSDLRSKILDLGLKKQVNLIGRVSNREIPNLLSQSDIFIRPSRFEGFGVSFLEAMASGVPVIGTTVGGIPDFVHDHQTGLLVKPENPDAIAQAIQELMTNPKVYYTLQKNALDLSRKHYNWDSISRNVEQTLAQLCTS